MIKIKTVVVWAVALMQVISCNNDYTIYEDAPLNSVIKRYSSEYYGLPENIDIIIEYLERMKRESPDTYFYTEPYLEKDMVDILKSGKFKYVYSKDSVLIYDKKNKDKYLIRGHPFFWLEHPDAYPDDSYDYWLRFRPSFFDETGHHLYEYDDIGSIVHSGKKYDAICKYDRVDDTLYIFSGSKAYYIPDYDTLLKNHIGKIKDTINAFINDNTKVYSYIFPMQLSTVGNLWVPKDMEPLLHANDSLPFNNERLIINTELFNQAHSVYNDTTDSVSPYYRYRIRQPDLTKDNAFFTISKGRSMGPKLSENSECIDNREINGMIFQCYKTNNTLYGYWYDAKHNVTYTCENPSPEDIMNYIALIKQVKWYSPDTSDLNQKF